MSAERPNPDYENVADQQKIKPGGIFPIIKFPGGGDLHEHIWEGSNGVGGLSTIQRPGGLKPIHTQPYHLEPSDKPWQTGQG